MQSILIHHFLHLFWRLQLVDVNLVVHDKFVLLEVLGLFLFHLLQVGWMFKVTLLGDLFVGEEVLEWQLVWVRIHWLILYLLIISLQCFLGDELVEIVLKLFPSLLNLLALILLQHLVIHNLVVLEWISGLLLILGLSLVFQVLHVLNVILVCSQVSQTLCLAQLYSHPHSNSTFCPLRLWLVTECMHLMYDLVLLVQAWCIL